MRRILFYFFLLMLSLTSCKRSLTNAVTSNDYPDVYPDYKDVTIPCNIAPLNFTSRTPVDRIDVVIKGQRTTLHLQRSNYINIPLDKWKILLQENVGKSLQVTVSFYYLKSWTTYKSFLIHISKESIDNKLVYRMITPEVDDSIFGRIGVYQRDLTNFEQAPIIVNSIAPGSFIDSYAFCRNNPDYMNIIVDSQHSASIIVSKIFNNEKYFETKTPKTISTCKSPYWHPHGRYIAYSNYLSQQIYHSSRHKHVDTVDKAADIVVYDTKENKLLMTPLLMTDALEMNPAFSADGKKLYFCVAQKNSVAQYKNIKYSLCSIDFNEQNGTFGDKVDVLLSSDTMGRSISYPRPSLDGRFLMFSVSYYGISSDWNAQSDLYLMDLRTGNYAPIAAVNSKLSESYHNWSTNGQWFVFTTNRDDGLFSRLYIASIDKEGKVTKPFMLPQKNPNDNVYSLYSFTLPEFVNKAVKLNVKRSSVQLMKENHKSFDY